MTEKHETKIISRRSAFGILGLCALSLVVAPTVLTVSDAEAQQPGTTQTPKTSTKTTQTHETGTQHRHERREGRREHRHERREARREHRHEESTVGQKPTGQQTGQKPTKPTGQQ
jgi:hypothetical protein